MGGPGRRAAFGGPGGPTMDARQEQANYGARAARGQFGQQWDESQADFVGLRPQLNPDCARSPPRGGPAEVDTLEKEGSAPRARGKSNPEETVPAAVLPGGGLSPCSKRSPIHKEALCGGSAQGRKNPRTQRKNKEL